jgi:hypothetical protein
MQADTEQKSRPINAQQSLRILVNFGFASKVIVTAIFGVVDVKRVGNSMRCHFFVTDVGYLPPTAVRALASQS